MSTPRHIRIFLSSPGDVASERAMALKTIEQLPYDPLLRGKITVEVIAWDKPGAGTVMLANQTPQEAINQGLPKPSECDIVIVIFWARMGTRLSKEYVKPEEFRFPTGTKWDDWRYLSGTEWEYIDAMQGAKENRLPYLVVYRRTEKVLLDPSAPDFTERLEQWQHTEAFFKSFKNPDDSIRQGYNSYDAPDEFREQFEKTHLRELVKRLLEAEARPIVSAKVAIPLPPLWTGSPFPGLRAFTPKDAPIFFGRGREIDALLKRVSEQRFVVVVGASGSGKSSLVGAGLIPHLMDNAIPGSKSWILQQYSPGESVSIQGAEKTTTFQVAGQPFNGIVRVVSMERGDHVPGNSRLPANPFNVLATIFAPAFDPQSMSDYSSDDMINAMLSLADELERNPKRLAELCQEKLHLREGGKVLFFIDQFEELFTLVTNENTRQAFIKMLAQSAQVEHIRTVVTLRADFYHHCLEYPILADLFRDTTFPLGAPGERALYEMITRPADRAGLQWEDERLPERILEDTGSEPGALALMAYALDELYHICRRDNSGLLSYVAYESLGGVRGAIGTRAEKIFSMLDPAAQEMLPHVFRELVEVDERGTATRHRSPLARFEHSAARTLIEQFVQARLLTASGNGAEAVVQRTRRCSTVGPG